MACTIVHNVLKGAPVKRATEQSGNTVQVFGTERTEINKYETCFPLHKNGDEVGVAARASTGEFCSVA